MDQQYVSTRPEGSVEGSEGVFELPKDALHNAAPGPLKDHPRCGEEARQGYGLTTTGYFEPPPPGTFVVEPKSGHELTSVLSPSCDGCLFQGDPAYLVCISYMRCSSTMNKMMEGVILVTRLKYASMKMTGEA